jgi:predicted DNA-binding transcriptional regulator AlpA
MEYTFTLKYQLAADDSDPAAIVERLGAAGCDDALVGTGVAGRIALAFTREAVGAEAALYSALEDIRRAIPGARLTEAGPDYVGLTDVADLLEMSRQNLRKLMLSHPATFPPPVHEGSASIWRLSELLRWFGGRGYALDRALMDTANAVRQVNLAKDAAQLAPETLRIFKPLVS